MESRNRIERTRRGSRHAPPSPLLIAFRRFQGQDAEAFFQRHPQRLVSRRGQPSPCQYTTRSPVEIPLAVDGSSEIPVISFTVRLGHGMAAVLRLPTRDSSYRFFIVTPTPAPSISRNDVSNAGFLVIASRYLGSGVG